MPVFRNSEPITLPAEICNRYATVHVVDLPEDSWDDVNGVETIKKVHPLFPTFLREGDIVVSKNGENYRGTGSKMITVKKGAFCLSKLNDEIDEHGSPAKSCPGVVFPFDYWDEQFMSIRQYDRSDPDRMVVYYFDPRTRKSYEERKNADEFPFDESLFGFEDDGEGKVDFPVKLGWHSWHDEDAFVYVSMKNLKVSLSKFKPLADPNVSEDEETTAFYYYAGEFSGRRYMLVMNCDMYDQYFPDDEESFLDASYFQNFSLETYKTKYSEGSVHLCIGDLALENQIEEGYVGINEMC